MIDVKLMEALLEALENCTLDRHGRETRLGHGAQLYQIRWSLGLYGSASNVLSTVPGMNDSTV
jgi:hypothetical protein